MRPWYFVSFSLLTQRSTSALLRVTRRLWRHTTNATLRPWKRSSPKMCVLCRRSRHCRSALTVSVDKIVNSIVDRITMMSFEYWMNANWRFSVCSPRDLLANNQINLKKMSFEYYLIISFTYISVEVKVSLATKNAILRKKLKRSNSIRVFHVTPQLDDIFWAHIKVFRMLFYVPTSKGVLFLRKTLMWRRCNVLSTFATKNGK